ncbi:hypothetical protein HUE87_12525 [Candidatus Sulfurimonas marisnigri]|uniref:Uncharacterized protein n=1 Tax=Candidatus Sulfurimonas marisnigri TaxID=2740405 RepID=A0A7S7M051_9BACT|nr:hypothetical protein [Candidatus Sulfurimonas marisnigri]QOY54662.1 hypothetical protein HUE87_12525 [Candidatus Sulfurimonas marisnigri]
MKPILAKELPNFLKRFGNFVHGELRNIEIISPTVIKLTIAGQDSARGFDWLTIELELSGVSDAKLLDSSKLLHVDMSNGINIIFEENSFAFGIGDYHNLSGIKNAVCYIISSSIKYKEGLF